MVEVSWFNDEEVDQVDYSLLNVLRIEAIERVGECLYFVSKVDHSFDSAYVKWTDLASACHP